MLESWVAIGIKAEPADDLEMMSPDNMHIHNVGCPEITEYTHRNKDEEP